MMQLDHIEWLESIGIEPEFFHLPRSILFADAWRYDLDYALFGGGTAEMVRLRDWWYLLGVGIRRDHPQEVLLRQFRILEEFLEDEDFNAWADGAALQSLTPPGVLAFRSFVLSVSERLSGRQGATAHRYFVPASSADYAACGIPQELLHRFAAHFRDVDLYRYNPDASLTPDGTCGFLGLSKWLGLSHPMSSTMYVALELYTPARIDEMRQQWSAYLQHQAVEPRVDARLIDGESMLRFSRGALIEFADLLTARLDAIAPNEQADRR